jgi:glucokinase
MRQFIVWDLGATKCAAALVTVADQQYQIVRSHSLKVRDCDSLADMAEQLHGALAVALNEVDGICIAAAGQYDGEELTLANPYPFPMRVAKVAVAQAWPHFEVIHDYAPIACRTLMPAMPGDEVLTIHPGQSQMHGRRVAFGVGTGLGVKDVVPLADGSFWLGCNEVGHMGLSLPPKMNRVEATVHREFVKFLQQHDELRNHVISFETVLSGKGLARLHQFVRGSRYRLTPEETAQAIKESDDEETLKMFAWYLGIFIATLQLVFMPTGGIWISGGVVHKNLDLFEEPYIRRLKRGLKCVPAYAEERLTFPIKVLCGQQHAFLGAAYYAQARFPLLVAG